MMHIFVYILLIFDIYSDLIEYISYINWFIIVPRMPIYSILFLILALIITADSQPCPSECQTCSSSTQCLTCASQYYAQSSTGTLECLPCSQYCLTCSSQQQCTRCLDPYVLGSDNKCYSCQVNNAIVCNSIVSASSCQQTYYVSDNYCYSCLLNCKECSSSSDCSTCISGYYLNTSVLTCNPCPSTHAGSCVSCDQYTPSRCLSCADGYQLSVTYTCQQIACAITNCKYCTNGGSACQQCQKFYYWNGSGCILGASVLCTQGAIGIYSTQCTNKCNEYTYKYGTDTQQFQCKIYNNIDIQEFTYYQLYFYPYNNPQSMQSMTGTTYTLQQQGNGQYSYLIDSSGGISLIDVPSYYRVSMYIKYRADQQLVLNLTAETQSLTQNQSLTLPATVSQVGVQQYSTVYLHSNNLYITPLNNKQLHLIQLLLIFKKCPSNCYRCLNQQYCQMCNQPQYVSSYNCVDNCTIFYHFVNNRSCLVSCPQQYYPVYLGENQKYCEPCVSPCLNCISETSCLSCQSGLYLYNYTCSSTCLDKYYPSTKTGECQPCISPCRTCTNQTACLSCDQGFWNGTHCSSVCPSGYYGDKILKQCVACELPCLTCRKNAKQCLSCSNSLYYHEYRCYQQCPDRYYPSSHNNTCMQCKSPCLTCLSQTECLSCSYNYLIEKSCSANCPQGYYKNISSKSCVRCSQQCLTCSSFSQCTSCSNGTCLLDGKCLSECTYGLYYSDVNASTGLCTCLQCKYPCKQCTSSDQCLSCLQGYLIEQNKTCKSTCPLGSYPDNSTFICSNCSNKYTNCLECSTSACKRCQSAYTLHNGQCLSSCPQLHYKQSYKCMKCIAPCLQCSSFTECVTCVSPYILHDSSCIIQCGSTQVAIKQDTNNTIQCIKCQQPCLSCSGTASNCTICQYGYYLSQPVQQNSTLQNQCILNCSIKTNVDQFTYYNQPISSKCSTCVFPCQTCLTQTHCLSCKIGYLTSQSLCQNCPYGTYADTNLGTCIACKPQCLTCYSQDYCISCQDGYYLYGYQCISNTSICFQNGYYVIGNTCQPCQMPCTTCQTTSTNCLSCVPGYIFYPPNLCLLQCPVSTYRNVSTCQPCHQYCQSCSTSSTYCFSCISPYYLVLNTMSCVTECPNRTYLQGTICQYCRYPCLECSSMNQCLSCISGTLVGTECLTSCASGYYSDENYICQPCEFPCKQCQLTANNCTQCSDGYYLFQDQCLQQCPQLYFGQQQAKLCLQCLGLCQQCSSHINCTTCSSDLIYYYNDNKGYAQCLTQCPISYFAQSVQYPVSSGSFRQQCSKCLDQCLTCQNNIQCILCNNNNKQHQGVCYEECPAQMFSSNGICQSCSQPCFNCTDTFTCTACMNDSFLLVGSAQCVVGQICPQGYYRITDTRNCNSECPAQEYHQNNRTCSALGCADDQYLGADYFCYSQCPEAYKANTTYHCVQCSGKQCDQGLFYNITYEIRNGQLFLYLIFGEDPIYGEGVTEPSIQLKPEFKHQIYLANSRRRLLQETQTELIRTNSERNITIQLFPQESIGQFQLTLTFNNALKTYKNPLQRISKKVYIQGYDKYPQNLFQLNLGYLLLLTALIGVVYNPYMTDFSQLVYLLALVNLHYPINLSYALQSSYLAHLIQLITFSQNLAQGYGKFSYVTNMGLLSNCLFNLSIVGIGLLCFLIVLIIYKILVKLVRYNRVDQEVNENQQNDNKNKQNIENSQIQQNKQYQEQVQGFPEGQSCKIKTIKCLQKYFLKNFINLYLNRLIYFNYLPISLFTFAQLYAMAFDAQQPKYFNDLISSSLSILMLILLLIYPAFIYKYGKPKFSFLMLKKLVLSAALILSIKNPTYMIGVTSVICVTTAILIYSYKLEKWLPQTKFITIMEALQFVILIFFAIFAIMGDGQHTQGRVNIGYMIIFGIAILCLLYIGFSVFVFVLWICKKSRGKDYIQEWKNNENSQDNATDSQKSNPELKSQSSKNQNDVGRSIQIQKILGNTRIDQVKSSDEKRDSQQLFKNSNGFSNNVNRSPHKNQQFWTYNNEDGDNSENDSENQAPDMLIRCVNQFSDYGGSRSGSAKQNRRKKKKQNENQGKKQ